jgi:hypothetical protein
VFEEAAIRLNVGRDSGIEEFACDLRGAAFVSNISVEIPPAMTTKAAGVLPGKKQNFTALCRL